MIRDGSFVRKADSTGNSLQIISGLFLLIVFSSQVYASCEDCVAPFTGEWGYKAAACSYFIPPGNVYGYVGNEAGIDSSVRNSLDDCQNFSGFDETAWVDKEFPEDVYKTHACGGGDEYPQYSSLRIERLNFRKISSECGAFGIHRYRAVGCPSGTEKHSSYAACQIKPANESNDKSRGYPSCNRNIAGTVGNPINVAYGNKIQREVDLAPFPLSGLGITRIYNSREVGTARSHRLGRGWRHALDYSIQYRQANDPYVVVETASLVRPDSQIVMFRLNDGVWVADEDVPGVLVRTVDGWDYSNGKDELEQYDAAGRIIRITKPSGVFLDYSYNLAGDIETITSSVGHSLSFIYDSNRQIISISDHAGRTWKYNYSSGETLESVVFPDATPADDTDNPVKQYHYENTNYPYALTGITDERGNRYANFEYGGDGKPTASYHGAQTGVLSDRIEGVSIAYSVNSRTVTNSRGESSTYNRSVILNVPVVTNISGPGCATCSAGNTSYIYDPLTRDLLSETENGVTTGYGNYDVNGNPGYRIEAKGTTEERRTDYTYDSRYFNKIATMTEPSVFAGSSKVTTYTYDDYGNRTSETIDGFEPDGTPVSRTTIYQYGGPLHQLSLVDGPRTDVSDITVYRYYPNDPVEGDNRARLKEIEDASGVLIRSNIQYTALGKVASEVRPNGLSLAYSYYSGNGRLETLTESDGSTSQVTRWSYLETGEVETITTADGTPDATVISFGYDDARRLVRVTDGLGNYTEYTLDTEGNRTNEQAFDSTGLLKKSLAQTFDIYNRLDTISQANEGRDYDYAPDGTLDQLTDGRGSVTDFGYDSLKRMLTSTRDLGGLGAVTEYGYDVADNLTLVADPVNGATGYVYDDLGNLISTNSPDTGSTSFTHDESGNIESKLDARGQLFIYSYDALNRLTGVDAPGTGDDITYSYDVCTRGTGRLCSVVTPARIASYGYDAFGNITDHQGIGYSHDAANRIRTMTYPSGVVISYGYDAAGQVSQVDLTVDGSTTALASNIDYAPFGLLESLTFGNGATFNQDADSAYRIISQSVPSVLDIGYDAYDSNGNLENRTDAFAGPGNYSYDALNRLDTVNGVFGSRDYDYDLNGNRTGLVSDTATTVYGYTPDSNRLVAETGWSYTLDANGNTTHRLSDEGEGRSFSYTMHNRITSVTDHVIVISGKGKKKTTTLQDVPVSAYSYNGLGQRTGKQVDGGSATQFIYGTDGSLLAETDESGTALREYVFLNGQLLAVLDPGEPQGTPGGEEIILDDGGPGTTATGSWLAKSSNKANAGDYLLASGGSGSTYRWTPDLTAGTYDVYVWYVKHRTHSTAPYSIIHAGQGTNVTVDQTAGGGAWHQIASGLVFDGSGSEFVEVSDANGKTTADAVRFVKTGGNPGGLTVTNIYYVHNDHLGTPQVMTDDQGSVVWQATYDPFGLAAVEAASSVEMNVRFPGQYYDAETGLHYNYYRYYDPETGRYLTSDPRGILLDYSSPERQIAMQMGIGIPADRQQGYLNHNYSYVGNNPVNRIDPTGEIDPVTAGFIVYGLLYLNHAGDAISEPNGNLGGVYNLQDDVCSLGPISTIANSCPVILEKCIGHDNCYKKYRCNLSSWIPTLLGGTKQCNKCNEGFFKQ